MLGEGIIAMVFFRIPVCFFRNYLLTGFGVTQSGNRAYITKFLNPESQGAVHHISCPFNIYLVQFLLICRVKRNKCGGMVYIFSAGNSVFQRWYISYISFYPFY